MPARLRAWLQRGAKPPAPASPEHRADPLLLAGQRLRQQREARGLNLRQLALNTRISTPVLEALERGWRERLPEATYLRTMLPLLERHLELEPGSLDGLMPASGSGGPERGRGSLLQRFTPGSIQVYSSWQGTLLYGLLTLALIYALNLEQRRLAADGLLALQPIPPSPVREQPMPDGPRAALLAALPELRPLERRSLQQALRRVGGDRGANAALNAAAASAGATSSAAAGGSAARAGRGVLLLRLQRPTRLTLRGGQGIRSDLQGVQGELAVPIEAGFQLQLVPAPAPDAVAPPVEWNGAPLAPLAGPPAGRYAVAMPAAPDAALPRP